MDEQADDDELALARASANLLTDLDQQLERLIHRSSSSHTGHGTLHTTVRKKHLEAIIKSIEPFQSDPQLLDPHLKSIVPPIAEAYLESLAISSHSNTRPGAIDLVTALSTILYTLCKVRGSKVISGLLNNEPRYFTLILDRLEQSSSKSDIWQVQYVLLLWLSHLLLTPFDLTSISEGQEADDTKTPTIVRRIAHASLAYLPQAAATQPVAALALNRLILRPDVQYTSLGRQLVTDSLSSVNQSRALTESASYTVLGHMRFLALIAKSRESAKVLPDIFRTYTTFMEEDTGSILADAVARSLMIKTLRNIVKTAIRGASSEPDLEAFIAQDDVIERTIEFFIRSLSDKETLVRHNAAKALSVIILELGSDMGAEIISAVLSILRDELPSTGAAEIVATANAFTCHGCTLAIAFALFQRSVPISLLFEIAAVSLATLTFAQRTTTGSISGTNIRDAANFALWSLARRYVTAELESVDHGSGGDRDIALIQRIAIHLLQSACCDPVGNIRRGSSAALQELVGRHPDKVQEGISLVQAVDYQAVGLRRRAMVDVVAAVVRTSDVYWTPMLDCLLGWRGLGSIDIPSRDAAATSLVHQLMLTKASKRDVVVASVLGRLDTTPLADVELRHGFILSLAMLAENLNDQTLDSRGKLMTQAHNLWRPQGLALGAAFSLRAIKALLPTAIARLATAVLIAQQSNVNGDVSALSGLDEFLDRLVSRSESSVLEVLPKLIISIYPPDVPNDSTNSVIEKFASRVSIDSTKPTLQGAGRIFALAALASPISKESANSSAIGGVLTACQSAHIDWRIAGTKALAVILATDGGQQAVISYGIETVQDVILQSLGDYTIDERGDIGSLVRLQAIERTQTFLHSSRFSHSGIDTRSLKAAILRLSLEKLTRVRLQAASCRASLSNTMLHAPDTSDVDCVEYFEAALTPLWQPDQEDWVMDALLEGLISCAGSSAEHILHNARLVMTRHLSSCAVSHRKLLITKYTLMLRTLTDKTATLHAALELLAFLLQMRLLDALQETDFKFLSLLSIVQKSHYKSTDVQRILAAVSVYVGLGRISTLRVEVCKKLLSMLKTSPYPKVKSAVADALFVLTHEEELRKRDWSKPAIHNSGTLGILQKRLLL